MAKDSTDVSFSKDVYPIIKKKCLVCHTADEENPSNYLMDSYGEIIAGGKNGKAIKPEHSDKSNFIIKLLPNPPFGKQMPMLSKKKLSDSTIVILKNWINQGAKNN